MHTIAITKYESADPRLDRHVEHDSRSLRFPVSAEVPAALTDVFWTDTAPILDQGNLGGCVGFTGADFLNTACAFPVRLKHHNGTFYTDASGRYFYHYATLSDSIPGSYPPDDTGSSGLGLAKALKKLGLITGYEHAFTWDHLTAAIATQPVCLGTLWTQTMFTPDKNGVIRAGSLADWNIAGGHEWMLRGISYTRGLVLGRNHWKASWDAGTSAQKLPGEFWLPITDLKALLASQGDVTVLKI